jgi:hypothetical protein
VQFSALIGVYVFGRNDDVVHLLRAAIEREGSQIAFAKRYGINRAYLNMVLSGKRPVGSAVVKAPGLRKVYVVG